MCDSLALVMVEVEPEKFHVQYMWSFMSGHQATEVLVPINCFFNTILTAIALHQQFDLRNILPRASSDTKCKVPLCKIENKSAIKSVILETMHRLHKLSNQLFIFFPLSVM